jgi:hypothetical protein
MEDWAPEDIERFRKYEGERVNKYYQENPAPKVQCPICAREVSQGWLENHQESRWCKPFGTGHERDFTEKDQVRRNKKREFCRAWRERMGLVSKKPSARNDANSTHD